MRHLLVLLLLSPLLFSLRAQEPEHALFPRESLPLMEAWQGLLLPSDEGNLSQPPHTIPTDTPAEAQPSFNSSTWLPLSLPHNWEQGEGLRGRKHGNLHGTAWYRKRFEVPASAKDRRIFIFFEGVGSFVEIWVNGQPAGFHAGGLTCFSVDITPFVQAGSSDNLLALRVSHPAGIRSLPWVCGACERAYGFSEGSQPFGIHRAVRLLLTDPSRIEPFGVQVWNDTSANQTSATALIRTELRNYGKTERALTLRQSVIDLQGNAVGISSRDLTLPGLASPAPLAAAISVETPHLWSPASPYLYTLRSELLDKASGTLIDRSDTPFGFRVVSWPSRKPGERGTLLINGKPVFLNGTCEYQHFLASSHAFSSEMVQARVAQIADAGFNAFRDAHHPHDLRYNSAWDRLGFPWWTQFGAHIWFDRDDFRANFKTLLREWVRERRNSPSLILWGLQNESVLPEDFARECTELIRAMDPTSPSQRLVTTCNGGRGTDWDVPQNWTGTYGGDPATYAADLSRDLLIGEYGAWRSQGLRNNKPDTPAPGFSEEEFSQLLGKKLILGASAADRSIGHFQWIFATHENPGRNAGPKGEQIADAWSPLGRIGPANNKGLLTLWGEPTDAWYLYRCFSIPAAKGPTVLIAGASDPDRWTAPGQPQEVTVFSNCDEVELFEEGQALHSLGRLQRPANHGPFVFKAIAPNTRRLVAIASLNGHPVAKDAVVLHHLPSGPHNGSTSQVQKDSLAALNPLTSVVRINCGGPSYTDSRGLLWQGDADSESPSQTGFRSWASAFPELDPALGSITRVNTPVEDTRDPRLYQTFRYGTRSLALSMPVPDGDYLVDLHFAEPWYGRGGGINATDWRLFDVAINQETRLINLDLFKEAGFGRALVRRLPVHVSDGLIQVSFPRCAANAAILCAVEVLSARPSVTDSSAPIPSIHDTNNDTPTRSQTGKEGLRPTPRSESGMSLYTNTSAEVASLPPFLQGLACFRPASPSQALSPPTLSSDCELFLALPETAPDSALSLGAVNTTLTKRGWSLLEEQIRCSGSGTRVFTLWQRHFLAGEKLSPLELPSGAPLFIAPTRPKPPAQALLKPKALHSLAPDTYRTQGGLQLGSRPQGVSGPALTRIPGELGDADWLITPASEPAPDFSLQLHAGDHIEVFVALDARLTVKPKWLAQWTSHPGRIALGDLPLTLYRRRFSQGDTITLGAPPPLPDSKVPLMYAVFSRLARPLITLPALPHSPTKPEASASPVPSPFLAPSPDSSSTPLQEGQSQLYTFAVGVGDRYFIVPHLHSEAPFTLSVELLSKDGAVLCESKHALGPGDEPGSLRVRSCSSINAGTYHARLTLLSASQPVVLEKLVIE